MLNSKNSKNSKNLSSITKQLCSHFKLFDNEYFLQNEKEKFLQKIDDFLTLKENLIINNTSFLNENLIIFISINSLSYLLMTKESERTEEVIVKKNGRYIKTKAGFFLGVSNNNEKIRKVKIQFKYLLSEKAPYEYKYNISDILIVSKENYIKIKNIYDEQKNNFYLSIINSSSNKKEEFKKLKQIDQMYCSAKIIRRFQNEKIKIADNILEKIILIFDSNIRNNNKEFDFNNFNDYNIILTKINYLKMLDKNKISFIFHDKENKYYYEKYDSYLTLNYRRFRNNDNLEIEFNNLQKNSIINPKICFITENYFEAFCLFLKESNSMIK